MSVDLLLAPVGWLESGPVPALLANPWTEYPTVAVLVVGALATGAGLGAAYDRLTVAARHGLIAAALLVAVYAPHRQGVAR
ncbi:MAG: hypothetical protein HOW97_34070 [Catenulispora sp.]|nr:hypothetical protein [Catenulispora sp.]